MRPSQQPRKEPNYESYVQFRDQYLSDSDPADYDAIVEQVLRASLNSSSESRRLIRLRLTPPPVKSQAVVRELRKHETTAKIANCLIKLLSQGKSPDDINIRDVSKQTGISRATVQRSLAWKTFHNERQVRKGHPVEPMPLSDSMLVFLKDARELDPGEQAAKNEETLRALKAEQARDEASDR